MNCCTLSVWFRTRQITRMIKAHRTYLLKVDLPSLKVLACSNHWHHTIVITSKLEMAKGLDGT